MVFCTIHFHLDFISCVGYTNAITVLINRLFSDAVPASVYIYRTVLSLLTSMLLIIINNAKDGGLTGEQALNPGLLQLVYQKSSKHWSGHELVEK
jgi:hypothetical protein